MPLFADRYEMGPVIGYGGMAEVRAADDTRLERPVAVKVMRRELAHQPLVRERFESEARLAARLMHPNVVSVFDSGEHDGLPYIVMERLPGDTLHDRLANGPMPEVEVRLLAAEILAALETAHSAGILHRDVKPANVLASGNGHWKVADFGIAKALEVNRGDATATGLVLGTPAYLAPERLYGSAATVASDLYSVGVVLYEALTGRRPFESRPGSPQDPGTPGAGAGGVAGGWPGVVTGAPLVPISTIRPGVDAHMAAAVERSLARDPLERFRSAAEMAAAISGAAELAGMAAGAEGAAAGAEVTSVMATGPATEVLPPTGAARTAVYGAAAMRPKRRRPGRNPAAPALALLAGAAVLAAVIIAAVGLAGGSHGGSPSTSRATTAPTATSTTGSTASTTTTTVAPSTSTTSTSTSTTTTTTTTTLLPITLPGTGGIPTKHHH